MVLYTRISERTERGEQPGVRLKLRRKICKASRGWGAFQTKEQTKGTKIPKSWKGKRKTRRQKTELFLQQDEGGSGQEKRSYLKWIHFIVCK